MDLAQLKTTLSSYTEPEKVSDYLRFFKTGPGEYGEGDLFLGITVPHCRLVAKQYQLISLHDCVALLHSKWHEERLVALLVLGFQFNKADETTREAIYSAYLKNTTFINNWDLVDLSCRDIVGRYIFDHPNLLPTLEKLAYSPLIWDKRIAIISTSYFLLKGDPTQTLKIADILVDDNHDLIQKATGWMLREMGKRVDRAPLIDFLKEHYDHLPRTTLRYAIEHFPAETRKRYLSGNFE